MDGLADGSGSKKYVDPRDAEEFVQYVRDVDGFEFNVSIRGGKPVAKLPGRIAVVSDTGSRAIPARLAIAAVPLHRLFDARGNLRYDSAADVRRAFGLSARCQIVVDGVTSDVRLEKFWSTVDSRRAAVALRKLRPLLVTTPNFSMFIDVPRHDNLYNAKRIAICASDFASAGLPLALHINGRTPRDFQRWAELLNRAVDVSHVAYEFGTLGRSATRRRHHVELLNDLARQVDRPLVLVARGGEAYRSELETVFSRVILLDSNPLMKAKYRRLAARRGNAVIYKPVTLPAECPIDQLFIKNVRTLVRADSKRLREGMMR